MKIKIGVLISGRGSNLGALIKACARPAYPAEIAIVISDREAPGLKLAEDIGIPTRVVRHMTRPGFALGIEWPLECHGTDLIVLAGFMRVLDARFVRSWEGRIVNIHPSLLPDFPGLHPQRQALTAKRSISGATVHWVTPTVDAGPIILQSAVKIKPKDTEKSLADRILAVEHQLYPYAIEQIAKEMLKNKIVATKLEE